MNNPMQQTEDAKSRADLKPPPPTPTEAADLAKRLETAYAPGRSGVPLSVKTLDVAAALLRSQEASLRFMEHEDVKKDVAYEELLARALSAETALREAEKSLEVCRQTITEQAMARLDPTMPLLTEEMVERIRGGSEAAYALADEQDDRIEAHALSLLCAWQDRARSALTLKQGGQDQGADSGSPTPLSGSPIPNQLCAALARQCDNMAFVLNRVDLHGFHDKFQAELMEDRALLPSEERGSGQ